MKQKLSKDKLPKLDQKDNNWQERYLRAIADYQNLERRIENQAMKFKNQANRELLLQILELIDDVDAAEIFIENEGLRLIKEKIDHILARNRVSEINLLGKPFDPNVSEVVEIENDSDNNDSIITKVLQKGYMINDELLRPARVSVGEKLSVTNH